MTFHSLIADDLRAFFYTEECGATPVTLIRESGEETPAMIFLDRAGLQEDGRQNRQQAVVRFLREAFPDPPRGRFEAEGLVWRLADLLGRADGTTRHQWAMLAVANTHAGVMK